MAALRGLPDSARGWQADKTAVKCQSCQAISVFDATRVGQRCDFCGSTALVPYEEVKDAFRPESLLPMKISENQVRDSIHRWYGSRWFAPNKLKRGALFVTDNTLWSGKAARPALADDKHTLGVQEFNRLVYAAKDLYPVLIPLRDGVTVCRKL